LPVEGLEPELEAELESELELEFDPEFDPESVLAGLAALSLLLPVDAEPEPELAFEF